MPNNDVTVLIPTFNRSALLVESLESVLAQTRPAHEIIVINDGSTDDTLDVLKPYQGKIRVISKSNGGKASALNLGMRHVSGGLVWIFDDDDIASPNALEVLVGMLESKPGANLAYGRHDRFRIDGFGRTRSFGTGYWRTCGSDEFLAETLDDMFAHQQGMVARKELYDRVGAFNEELIRSQDYDMLIRLARVATTVATNKVVFHQRLHDGIRGTDSKPVPASSRDSAWSSFDKIIFRKCYPQLRLHEYLKKGRSDMNPVMHRQALLRRASVMARKKLWNLTLADLRSAVATSQEPLTKAEITILRGAFSSKYGCEEILRDPKLIDELCKLAATSPAAAEVVAPLARGLRWKVRSELFGMKIWRSVSYFLIMNKLRKAASKASREFNPEPASLGRSIRRFGSL
jgi:glycosyltransferase involved in cell wall biosynthesis